MAKQRIWRWGVDAPPPEDWTRVYIPASTVKHGRFERSEPKYLNVNWFDNCYTWIIDQPGEYCYCFGNRPAEYPGEDCYLFAFSDPLVGFEFKLQWG